MGTSCYSKDCSRSLSASALASSASSSRWSGVGYSAIPQADHNTDNIEDSDNDTLDHQRSSRQQYNNSENTPMLRGARSRMELSIHNRRLFLGSFLIVEALGLLLVTLTIVWVEKHKGGVKWSQTDLGIDFNWHPILMTLSLIFLYGNGALIYRVIPPRSDQHKLVLKIGHATIMMMAVVVMVIGLQAAFDSHNYASPPKPNMYTLHSWIGLVAAILFGCQWTLGFTAFLFPKFSSDLRALVLEFHQYFGSSILALAGAAALMGHLEKAIWSNNPGYGQKNPEAIMVNCCGLLIIFFIMGITFLLSKFSKDVKINMH